MTETIRGVTESGLFESDRSVRGEDIAQAEADGCQRAQASVAAACCGRGEPSMNEITRGSMELTVMKPLTAAIVYAPGGVDSILEKIFNEVRAIETDISTPAGRAAVASLAYKVARSKTALDEMGKQLVSEWKQKASAVDAERRTIREKLDALKDEVRTPLTEWEQADKRRIDRHEIELSRIDILGCFANDELSSAEIGIRIAALEALPERDWQEFSKRALELRGQIALKLRFAHEAASKREAERAELERLRREQVEREQRERDERIALEAAERARREAEEKAAAEASKAAEVARREQERLEAARHAAQLEAVRVESERREAQLRADAAEAARIEQAAQAERDRQAAEALAQARAREAAERAERDKQAAIATERKRAAEAKAAEDAATAKREADKKHRAKINNEILQALCEPNGPLTPDQGKAIITAIAQKKIPHIVILY